MTGTMCLWMVTWFLATITSSVILIQHGGWLCILLGILLVLFYFVAGVAVMTISAACSMYKEKYRRATKQEEEKK